MDRVLCLRWSSLGSGNTRVAIFVCPADSLFPLSNDNLLIQAHEEQCLVDFVIDQFVSDPETEAADHQSTGEVDFNPSRRLV